jgi:hypothetical protein
MNVQKLLQSFWLQTLSVMIRASLIGWGGALVQASGGLITQDAVTTTVGGIMIVLAVLWSLFEKFVVTKFFKNLPFGL